MKTTDEIDRNGTVIDWRTESADEGMFAHTVPYNLLARTGLTKNGL